MRRRSPRLQHRCHLRRDADRAGGRCRRRRRSPNQGSDAAADAADAAADRVDAAADRVDAASADTGFGVSAVRATIDGVPVIFDNVTTVSLLSDVVSIIASTGDGTATIKIYTASGTGGNVRLAPSSYGCTGSDIGHIIYTVTEGGPDAGPGTTYGDTGYNSSPCSVLYEGDFTRTGNVRGHLAWAGRIQSARQRRHRRRLPLRLAPARAALGHRILVSPAIRQSLSRLPRLTNITVGSRRPPRRSPF